MAGYDELLKRGKERLPEFTKSSERFEIPKVKGHLQGNKTVVSNFGQICSSLNRDPQHILKYLQRELASPAEINGPRLVLGRKLSASLINSKIEKYAKNFVLCPDCNRPDTQLIREDKVLVLKCAACGAKHPVRAKI